MKKHIAMLCAVLLTALAAFAPGAAAAGPALTATEAYCIIDADTGLVLAQQNMNEELHPASITKVMTLGLACEKAQGKWDNVKLTVSHEDVYSLAGTDSSPDRCTVCHHDGQRQRWGQPAGRILRRRLH